MGIQEASLVRGTEAHEEVRGSAASVDIMTEVRRLKRMLAEEGKTGKESVTEIHRASLNERGSQNKH